MKYAQIRSLDVSNGKGIGVSLFVQGCHFHCFNCFNSDTWSFKSGKEWTKEIENKFVSIANNPHIDRISILGGEPLAPENVVNVITLCKRLSITNKQIWVFTGYKIDELNDIQREVLDYIDVLIDGRYVDELRDQSLAFRGSSNQHIWKKIEGEWRIIDFDKDGDMILVSEGNA